MAQVAPRYVWGLINPTVGVNERESNDKSEPLLPRTSAVVSNGLGISDYTVEGVEEAIARYDVLAAELVGPRRQAGRPGGDPHIGPARPQARAGADALYAGAVRCSRRCCSRGSHCGDAAHGSEQGCGGEPLGG